MTDIPGNTSTGARINVGGSVGGSLEVVGDRDWYAITLTAGQSITVTLLGFGSSPVPDSYLRIHDAAGNEIAHNDDGAGNYNSLLNFTATTAGTYYIDVGSYADSYAGTYELQVSPYVPPPVFDYDQIADQLVNGFWENQGGSSRHFNVTQGGTITVNLVELNATEQYLARHALQLWSDALGINFSETGNSNAQITFHHDDGDASDISAFSTSSTSGGLIISSEVNIDSGWVSTYGTDLNSYSFQTYLHEIGHALGLGHAGNYNGSADYQADALYQNDAWTTTVMSYFSQEQNSYFANQGFSYDYAVTPMLGDLVAMSDLYGSPTTTRTGNTTYGFNNTSGREVFDAAANPDVAYTIIDNGGIDTLDYSGFSSNQHIDLNPETFSDVGDSIGNVSIARGTVIENAIGGSGNDTLIGNAANNVLTGNGGDDTIDGGAGNDTASYAGAASGVTIDLGVTIAQNSGGAGVETLASIENLIGSAFNDVLTGNAAANTLVGGGGDDRLNGGGGIDTADYTGSASAVAVSLDIAGVQNTRGAGMDVLSSIEQLVGSVFADRLYGNDGDNMLSGGNGNDLLVGGAGNDLLQGGEGTDTLDGGLGDDRLFGGNGSDYITYATARAGVTVNLSLTAVQDTGGGGRDQILDVERLYGSNYNDVLTGSSVDNLITGRSGDDIIHGGTGYDRVQGDAGNDQIFGEDGNDVIIGGAGNDVLKGGEGNDRLYGQTGNDVIDGGNGIDILYYADAAAGVTVNLNLATAQDTIGAGIDTITGIERLVGSRYDDHLTGAAAAERLIGGVGNDTVLGGAGNDIVQGDAGNDLVGGGAGNDSVYGGAGQDLFRFDSALNGSTNVDSLRDFSSADDSFQLSQSVFSAIASGTLDASAFHIGTSAADASDRIIYDQASGRLYYDADGNGAGSQVLFARLHAGVALTSADFVVVGSGQALQQSSLAKSAGDMPMLETHAAVTTEMSGGSELLALQHPSFSGVDHWAPIVDANVYDHSIF